MPVVRFSVHLSDIDPEDQTTPRHWERKSTRPWPNVPRQGDLVSLDDQDVMLRPLTMAAYHADYVDLSFCQDVSAGDIPMLRRLGFRPSDVAVGDEPFTADLPATNLRDRLLSACLKQLVRGDNRDEPDDRCWRAFTSALGLDPDLQGPYNAKHFSRAMYTVVVDIFAELSGLAAHHGNHGWPSDPETLVAVEAVDAFHQAVAEPGIPEEERATVHVEALVQCLRQWVTDIPLGLADAVRDLENPTFPSSWQGSGGE